MNAQLIRGHAVLARLVPAATLLLIGAPFAGGQVAERAPGSSGSGTGSAPTRITASVEEDVAVDITMTFNPHACSTNSDCADGRYCRKRVGECDDLGRCRRIPQHCPEVYQPVCGCDGATYDNRCFAAAAGVSIDHPGACLPAVGKCCLEGGACIDATAEECDFQCGHFGGPDSRCTGTPMDCPIPPIQIAACCLPDGECIIDTACRCANQGGIGQDSVDCAAACAPVGRCCLIETGGCVVTTAEDCAEQCGLFAGPGTDCLPPLCPIPPVVAAACCLPDGECVIDSQCACEQAGGIWQNTADCTASLCGEPELCDGFTGLPCSDPGDFCLHGPGECCCDFLGECTPVPESCPLIYAPVCGCDGNTYGNRCLAHANRVNVDHPGPCASDEPCSSNDDCGGTGTADDQFCMTPPGNCATTGMCAARPQICPFVYLPVCGCDGQTYGNACLANAAGVNIDHPGTCGSGGGACTSNANCAMSPLGLFPEYCATAPGDCAGEGTCTPVPQFCLDVFDPVCGCNGQTYPNACYASRFGISVATEGPCGH